MRIQTDVDERVKLLAAVRRSGSALGVLAEFLKLDGLAVLVSCMEDTLKRPSGADRLLLEIFRVLRILPLSRHHRTTMEKVAAASTVGRQLKRQLKVVAKRERERSVLEKKREGERKQAQLERSVLEKKREGERKQA